jgi:glucose-1-phosphate cytidylyltransferase
MKMYAHYGFHRFILCLGYKGEQIKEYFLKQEMMENDVTIRLGDRSHDHIHRKTEADDWEITLAETGLKTFTGGRVKRIEKYIDTPHFLVSYGDGVGNVDFGSLLKLHLTNNTIGTLTAVKPPSRFGMIDMEGSKVVRFREKPVMNEYVNGGYYVFKKEFFGRLEDEDTCTLEKEPLSGLAGDGQLSVFKHEGFWHMMDNYKDYLDLNRIWDSGSVPWKKWK